MKRFIIIFSVIFSVIFSACKNKSVQLPQIPEEGITSVYNHSQIWVFYKQEDDHIMADVNKNNLISTTHWIINIDKRLPMSQVLPVFKMVKEKRAKKTIHSVDGMHDYLNYADIKHQTNALFQIDSLTVTSYSNKDFDTFKKGQYNNLILLNPETILINQTKIDYSEIDDKINDFLSSDPVILCYKNSLTYQKYLESKVLLSKILHNDCQLSNDEICIID